MKLALKIALRYLFARKSYNVINLISGIGVAGMAVGTAALVVILSVFNGFDALVSQSLTDAHPDLMVKPAAGKVFSTEGLEWIPDSPDILRLSSVLEEQVFLSYEGKQSLARVKGIDEAAQEESALQNHLIDGDWEFHKGDYPAAVAGAGLAASLGMNPRFVAPLELHYPSRTEAVSLANPAASLRGQKVLLSGVFSISSDLDAKLLLVPIGTVRELLEYPVEVSYLEIGTAPGKTRAVQEDLSRRLGPSFRVLDRCLGCGHNALFCGVSHRLHALHRPEHDDALSRPCAQPCSRPPGPLGQARARQILHAAAGQILCPAAGQTGRTAPGQPAHLVGGRT